MKHRGIKFASPVLIAAALGAVFWVNAGQLAPPAGAIMATGPTTLNQADIGAGPLFNLNSSGSYILTSDIVAPGGYTGDGIEISADNVTLNMNGFALIGVAGSQSGIRVVTPARYNISIYNGTVRDWGDHGVDAIRARNSQLRNLRAYSNGGDGMILGSAGTISDCVARSNAGNGISFQGGMFQGSAASITGCVAALNILNGIVTPTDANITACVVLGNGAHGIFVGNGSTITGCTARSNVGDGINVNDGSTVTGCAAHDNLGDGIEAEDSLIHGNSATANGGAAINDLGGSLLVNNNT